MESNELIPIERIRESLENLKKLNASRTAISNKLSEVYAKLKLRQKVLKHLYEYYELIADDYYALEEGIISYYEVAEYMKEEFEKQLEIFKNQMNKLRETLNNPLKVNQLNEKIDKITNHIFYVRPE